jgi:Predicted phosphatases
MKYSHLLWDFNGTILNDVDTGIKSVNTLLKCRGLKLLESVDEYQEVFTFPVINYYHKLGFDFESESYDDIAVEWVAEYMENVKSAEINRGIVDVLKSVTVPQIILSASEINMLTTQLTNLSIIGYFDEILGLDNIKAGSKIDIAVDWMNRVKPKSALLIGDTVHDYETAKAIGVDCILVTFGHQKRGTLLQYGVPVIDDIGEIFNYLL